MSTQYWEEELETMSREKLQELQLQRLKKTINIAANANLTCAPTTRSDWWQVI